MQPVARPHLMLDVCSLVRTNQSNSRQFDNATKRDESVPQAAPEPQIPQNKIVPGENGKKTVQKGTPRKEAKSKERTEARPEPEEHAIAGDHARRSKM